MFLISLLFSISPDCPDIVTLVTGLNMNIVNPSLFYQIALDCCSVGEITCSNDRVTMISINNYQLNGTINTTAIPPTVTSVSITNSQIYGSISTFPESVTVIQLTNNKLNGTIAPFNNQVQRVVLDTNYFNCNAPKIPESTLLYSIKSNRFTGQLSPMPINLTFIMLNDNLLTGNIGILPDNLENFLAGRNLFTGCLPNLYSPKLSSFWVQDSLLTGPVSPLHPNLYELLLDRNPVHGSIRIYRPRYLAAPHSNVTEVVVLDTSRNTYCDFSYTPTLGNLNIQNITNICDFTGNYNASSDVELVTECLAPSSKSTTATTESITSENTASENATSETVSSPNDQNSFPTIVTRIFKQATTSTTKQTTLQSLNTIPAILTKFMTSSTIHLTLMNPDQSALLKFTISAIIRFSLSLILMIVIIEQTLKKVGPRKRKTKQSLGFVTN
eukprot:NODE_99_length_20465_cov_0.827654.p2 type:complete len:443 gc:universal NODE_99_length_20465_cov_0.827654:14547-13219(-)